MQVEERAELVAALEESLAAMQREVRGLTPAQAEYRSAEGRWSILDCLEHVCKTESGMFVLMTAMATDKPAAQSGREQQFAQSLLDRSRKIAAPERVQPRGVYPSVEDALDGFRARRLRTIEYVTETEDNLHGRSTTHPVAGEITCRECLSLLIGHALRHIEQIREIKREPGYPG